jgi:amino acid transporter
VAQPEYGAPLPTAIPVAQPAGGETPYKPSCKIITAVILVSITLILLISATASTWSLIEIERNGNDYDFKLFLSKVKQEKTAPETWDDYDDFVDNFSSYSSCKTMTKGFRSASEAAKGLLFLPYITVIGFLVLSIVSIIMKMKNAKLNLAMSIVAICACVSVLIPSSAWSGEVPSRDDLKDCFNYNTLKYWPSHNGPWFLRVSIILLIISCVFSFVESKKAKKHYAKE